MAIIMGPVLKFIGEDEAHKWHVSALIVTEGETPACAIQYDGLAPAQQSSGVTLAEYGGRKVLRYDMAVPRREAELIATYSIEGAAKPTFNFHVPALNGQLNIAYASCNGFSEPGLMKDVNDHFAMWEDLRTAVPETKAGAPITHNHLLILGGDQIYADSIWLEKEEIGFWSTLDNETANAAPVTEKMQKELDDFYFELYVKRWAWPSDTARKHSAHAMASIPSLMMWDDHDIIDGWGSYSPTRNECNVFKALFKAAARNFDLFQQQEVRDTNMTYSGYVRQDGPRSFMHQIDGVVILGLDLRTERTPQQVISKEHWEEIYNRLETAADPVRHVLVLSSIPMVHADFSVVQSAFTLWPGKQELEDDLLDHWDNEQHSEERLRFIHRMSRFANARNAAITILSGDVHIGAFGTIENSRPELKNKVVMHQLTSSGIVHPPPGGFARYVIEKVFATTEDEIDDGIIAKLMPPGAGKRLFVGSRNWLSLDIEPDKTGRIWVKWHAEKDPGTPRTKVLHPVQTA